MICKMCATGADMQSRANEITAQSNEPEGSFASELREAGLELHASFCKGKTHCDCHHKPVGEGNVQI